MAYVQNMTTQEPGRNIIKKFEGYEEVAYFPTKAEAEEGIYTIGRGHRDPKVKKGERWTPAKIEQVFKADVIIHENRMKKDVKVPLNQNQFDALSSFAYNTGSLRNKDGTDTTLKTLLNKKDYAGASKQISRFVYQGTTFLEGLKRRRKLEKDLFDKGVGTPPPQAKTDEQTKAEKDAKAKKEAEVKAQKILQDKLTAEDTKQELAEKELKKKAELTKNKQEIDKANATAKKNSEARKKGIEEAKVKDNTISGKVKQSNVLKSGFSIIGLIVMIIVLNNIELPTTELE